MLIHTYRRSKTHLLTLYFLDSGAYARTWFDFAGIGHGPDYDWIHQDQIDWFLEESGELILSSMIVCDVVHFNHSQPAFHPLRGRSRRTVLRTWVPSGSDRQRIKSRLMHVVLRNQTRSCSSTYPCTSRQFLSCVLPSDFGRLQRGSILCCRRRSSNRQTARLWRAARRQWQREEARRVLP